MAGYPEVEDMEHRNPIVPVLCGNRGLMMIVRMALAQAGYEAMPVPDPGAWKRAFAETRSRIGVVSAEDLRVAGTGLDALAVVPGHGGGLVVLGNPDPGVGLAAPGVRYIPIPFTSLDVASALTAFETSLPVPISIQVPRVPLPVAVVPREVPSPEIDRDRLEPLVREVVAVEVERLVADQSRRVIETLVHRLVPELAESLLKQEIARLVREGEEAALAATEPKPAEDSGLRRP